MHHIGVVGPTGCGKSHLVKSICRERMAAGVTVSVCDPIPEKWGSWPCNFITSDPHQFYDHAQQTDNHLLVMDEFGETMGSGADWHDQRKFKWFGSSSRHNDGTKRTGKPTGAGHQCIFIYWQPADVLPAIRRNCKITYLFNVDVDSAKVYAKIYNQPEVLKAAQLPPYHFYRVTYFDKPTIHKI